MAGRPAEGLLPYVVSFVVGGLVATANHITARFPNTYWALIRCPQMYAHAALYGIVAVIFLALVPYLVANGQINLAVNGQLTQAAIVGVLARPLTRVNLAVAKIGGQQVPVGTELIVRFFEASLQRKMAFHEWQVIDARVSSKAKLPKFSDLEGVQKLATADLPSALGEEEINAFKVEVNTAKNVKAVMSSYLAFAGQKMFDKTFAS